MKLYKCVKPTANAHHQNYLPDKDIALKSFLTTSCEFKPVSERVEIFILKFSKFFCPLHLTLYRPPINLISLQPRAFTNRFKLFSIRTRVK